MSSIDTYSTTKDLVFDEFVASYRSDELRFEVFFVSCFFSYPLDYPGGKILDLRLPRSKKLSYKEMNDLLLNKTKDDIWKLFYCKPKCSLEKGLTLVKNDRDMEKMFELANLQGTLDVYVCHIPQVILVDYYFKNLCVVFESDEEVTSIYRSHEKARKDANTMSLEELIAWEQEEAHSPSYLRSPHVWQRTPDINGKGKVLLDDFKDVGSGKVLLDDFEAVGNGKDKVAFDALKGDGEQTVTALEFITHGGEIGGGCFGDIKSYLKNGKLEKVVAIITSCTPNVIGDMNVTLKDPSGTMSGIIHYKVLLDDGYAKDIKVGYALILRNVSVFCPKSSNYALNITLRNLVKIFQKDTVVEDADGASAIDSKSELLSEQVLLFVKREMARELRMTRLLTNLCHEVTNAVKDKEDVIEEVKELGMAGSDIMAFLRILRDEE
ncbi:transposase, MuDR, MULE transposase domain protein [Tanacetum coccineum]